MKATFKVTPKTTKAQLLEVLTANAQNTEGVDQSTKDTAAYAIQNPDKATRADLSTLVKTLMTTLGDKFIVPAFAESKPKTEDKPSKPEDLLKASKGAKNANPPKAEKPKKSAKSADADGGSEKSEKTSKGAANNMMATAETFPETITIGDETFKLAHDVKTIEDLAEGEYEFAFWWTKRHLKQFPYFQGAFGQPKSFPNDLDTAQLIYVSDEGKCAYCVSDSTEAFYSIVSGDLEEVDGVRCSKLTSIEFQIYRKVEDETEGGENDTEDEGKAE